MMLHTFNILPVNNLLDSAQAKYNSADLLSMYKRIILPCPKIVKPPALTLQDAPSGPAIH